MAYNVFLSHSGADQGWVQWIANNARSIDINVYMYTWVEPPDPPFVAFGKGSHTLNLQFYLEKNGELFIVNNFRKDLIPLIKDKVVVFIEYKRQKIRSKDSNMKKNKVYYVIAGGLLVVANRWQAPVHVKKSSLVPGYAFL